MNVETIVSEVYDLPGCEPAKNQNADQVHSFIDLVETVVYPKVAPRPEDELTGFSEGEYSRIESALEALRGRHSYARHESFVVGFFPKYAAALVGTFSEIDIVKLDLLSLDKWSFHCKGLGRAREEHTASSDVFFTLFCGEVQLEDLGRLTTDIKNVLKFPKKNESVKESRWSHQKTPAYLYKVVEETMENFNRSGTDLLELLPRGGTTDVGLHTGGKPRNTVWPLVRAALEWLLGGQTRAKIESRIDFNVLDRLTYSMESTRSEATRKRIDVAFQVLDSASVRCAQWLSDDLQAGESTARIQGVRARLDRFVNHLAEQTSKTYTFPELNDPEDHHIGIWKKENGATGGVKRPKVDPDVARTQIGGLPILPENAGILETTQWMEDSRLRACDSEGADSILPLRLYINTIEGMIFKQADRLETLEVITGAEAVAIVKIVDAYKSRVDRWLRSDVSSSLPYNITRSHEILVLWICAALLFQRLCQEHPLVEEFGISLRPSDLQYIVTADKRAVDGLRCLLLFLRRHQKTEDLTIFSCRENEMKGTQKFAKSYAEQCPKMMERWESEKAAVNERETRHWQTILLQKNRAEELSCEIEEAQAQLVARILERDEIPCGEPEAQFERRWANKKIKTARKKLQSLVQVRNLTLVPPQGVIHPLPKKPSKALPVIFYLEMPQDFQVFCRICFEAQFGLVPRDPYTYPVHMRGNQVLRELSSAQPTTWAQHYSRHSGLSGTDKYMRFYPENLDVPVSRIGPQNVEYISEISQCVWYPNQATKLCPPGRTNPFLIQERHIKTFLSTPLPDRLGWLMECTESHRLDTSGRGNTAFAQMQAHSVLGISKQQLLELSHVRAQSCSQQRRIANAVAKNSLPWYHPVVGAVLRQAAYETGPWDPEKWDMPVSRHEIRTHGCREALLDDIVRLMTFMKETPREHPSFPLLAEMAAHFSQWSDSSASKRIRGVLVEVCESWIKSIGERLQVSKTMEDKIALYVERALIASYAILCYDFGNAHTVRTFKLCRFLFEASYSQVFIEEVRDPQRRASIRDLSLRRYDILSRIIPKLSLKLHSTNTITQALECIIPELSHSGAWFQLVDAGNHLRLTSFEKFSGSDHYVVDLLSGKLLINGAPPGRLPSTIQTSPQFLRCFGGIDFEVRCSHNGRRFTTVRPVPGRAGKSSCFYEFDICPPANITISERPAGQTDGGPVLTLCDVSIDYESNLPTRLKELHSHWLARDLGLIALRDISYTGLEISYVCQVRDSPSCFLVPENHRRKNLNELQPLLKSFDFAVAPPDCWTRVLAKFESTEFIHCWRSREGTFTLALPRYGLSFCLDDSHRLRSKDFRDYCLAECQQLGNWLPFFTTYLLLSKVDPQNPFCATHKILVPNGTVSKRNSEMVQIDIDESAAANLKCYTFDVNTSLRQIKASSRSGRLMLAAIHAAAGTLLPDSFLDQTGHEYAMYLLRRSTATCPLESTEAEILTNMVSLGAERCQLTILGRYLWSKSHRLARCHSLQVPDEPCTQQAWRDAGNRLLILQSVQPFNQLRYGLTTHEHRVNALSTPKVVFKPKASCKLLVPIPKFVADEFIRDVEDELKGLAGVDEPKGPESIANKGREHAFPLDYGIRNEISGDSGRYMMKEMMNDLQDSWNYHQGGETVPLAGNPKVHLPKFMRLLGEVTKRRLLLSLVLSENLLETPKKHSSAFHVLQRVNRFPTLVPTDYLMALVEDWKFLRNFNPFLSESDARSLKEAVRYYLELWVLEDKLRRLTFFATENRSPSKVQQELLCTRKWKSEGHPAWLAFEVENELQIRPEQYRIACHLIYNKGDICQLNMGLGKTRVVLPMLVLYFIGERHRNGKVPRLHFPTPLLGEALDYFTEVLGAGVFAVPVFLQPFHRDVVADEALVRRMKGELDTCLKLGGFQVVAIEHRLSLLLKWHETRHNGSTTLKSFLDMLHDRCIDIFDESDALLSHKYQLIYAVGTPQELPQAKSRSLAVHCVLRAIYRALAPTSADSDEERGPRSELRELLRNTNVASTDPAPQPWAFAPLRLVEAEQDATCRRELRTLLIKCLLHDPLNGLAWLQEYAERDPTFERELVDAVTQRRSKMERYIKKGQFAVDSHWHVCLALQALLGHGLLELCLSKRHRVHYGIDKRSHRRKKLAVPYTAADVPSERSEYSHPDVALVYTALAYYYDGVSLEDVVDGVRRLLSLGPSAQRFHHARWMSVFPTAVVDEVSSIDDVRKLDPNSVVQQKVLQKYLSRNTEFINFWIDSFIVGVDTNLYPGKLIASACHLPGGHAIGFSGTNDNSRLLPPSVQQAEVDIVRGTNGKMLDVILSYGSLHVLPGKQSSADDCAGGKFGPGADDDQTQKWMLVLDFVIASGLDAIIDTGSLLAGVKPSDAAEHVTRHSAFKWTGVIFFESSGGPHGRWMIRDAATGLCQSRESSPILDGECFIIFDEARTRGADMKMRNQANGAITLGPRLTKDRFMQGAGRLRQLGQGQTIQVLCPLEIAFEIRNALNIHDLRMRNVLEWIMANTQKECVDGLSEYASQVLYYATTKDNPDVAVLEEKWDLESMYHADQEPSKLSDHIKDKARHFKSRVTVQLPQEAEETVENLLEKSDRYGADAMVVVSQCDEQCEREIQQEEEAEKELEPEIPSLEPYQENYWNYQAILSLGSVKDIGALTELVAPFLTLAARAGIPGLSKVIWRLPDQLERVFATKNFTRTVEIPIGGSGGRFLRPIDGLLIFPDRTILILSDRESDGVLRALWEMIKGKQKPRVTFVHLYRLQRQLESRGNSSDELLDSQAVMSLGSHENTVYQWDVTALRLANGETNYPTKESREHLRLMLPSPAAREAVQRLCRLQGNGVDWSCSDLEAVCSHIGA